MRNVWETFIPPSPVQNSKGLHIYNYSLSYGYHCTKVGNYQENG